MDLNKTLRDLYKEKKRLDTAIAILEARCQASAARPAQRRGRKNMTAEERLRVSERMTQYWRDRRAQARPLEDSIAVPGFDAAGNGASSAAAG